MSDRVQEIRVRLFASSPGIWEEYVMEPEMAHSVANGAFHNPLSHGGRAFHAIIEHGRKEDATFIANAKADIGYLLDRLAQYEGRMDAVTDAHRALGYDPEECSECGQILPCPTVLALGESEPA